MGLDSHPPHEEQSPTAPNHVMLEIRQVRFRFSGFADLMEVPGFGSGSGPSKETLHDLNIRYRFCVGSEVTSSMCQTEPRPWQNN